MRPPRTLRRLAVAALSGALLGAPPLTASVPPSAQGNTTGDYEIRLKRFLPRKHVRDGTVDYSVQFQAAIDAAAGKTLLLPDYPILVSDPGGTRTCLVIRQPITIRGSVGSVLRVGGTGLQGLRVEGVSGVHLEGFTIAGPAGNAAGAAHGMVQITGGRDITIEDVTLLAPDVDGIAIADAEDVRVSGCRVRDAAKAGIYLANCTRAVVSDNVVSAFGGHLTAAGEVVGTGIQISSSHDVVCSGNVVKDGTGIGILCNAYANGRKPWGCVIRGNRIANVANAANPNVSGGIRCTNGHLDGTTSTSITGNSVQRCGAYGIYVENHGGSTIAANTILESERSGILVGTIQHLAVVANVILDSDVSGFGAPGDEAGITLINDATAVTARGNVIRNTDPYAGGSAREGVRDASRVGGNDLEPRIAFATAAPVAGDWRQGDRVYNSEPRLGEQSGWICVSSGSPGVWSGLGTIP